VADRALVVRAREAADAAAEQLEEVAIKSLDQRREL
jgi:hypothetical protein